MEEEEGALARDEHEYQKLVGEDERGDDEHVLQPPYRKSDDRASVADSVASWRRNHGGRNVRLALLFTFTAGTARGVWSYTVLSGYLYALSETNSAVGVAEGAQGLAQLAMALVAGAILLAEDQRRDRVLKTASVLGLIAAAGLLLALSMGVNTWRLGAEWALGDMSSALQLMTVALALFGSYQGFWSTALETIYADSVPTGRRASLNTKKFVLTLLASCSGPLIGNIYFYTVGQDQWSTGALREIFFVGVALCVPPMLLLCFFRDEDCLGKSAEGVGLHDHVSVIPVMTF